MFSSNNYCRVFVSPHACKNHPLTGGCVYHDKQVFFVILSCFLSWRRLPSAWGRILVDAPRSSQSSKLLGACSRKAMPCRSLATQYDQEVSEGWHDRAEVFGAGTSEQARSLCREARGLAEDRDDEVAQAAPDLEAVARRHGRARLYRLYRMYQAGR